MGLDVLRKPIHRATKPAPERGFFLPDSPMTTVPTAADLLRTTEELVRIRSVADRPDELRRAVGYVEAFFSDVPSLRLRRYERNGKPSIVVGTTDTMHPDVLLAGHLDVVPASDAMFEPVRDGTKLLGRGVCDMKSEDAVMMWLLRELAARPHPPSVALMLTTDEEIGGRDGVGYLVNDAGYRAKVALVPDGGLSPDELILETKGILQVRLTARGRSAHGSRPWLGENALDRLVDAYVGIRGRFPKDAGEEGHWHATMNLGTLRGGTAVNQVPDEAVCDIDIRYPASVGRATVLDVVTSSANGCTVDLVLDDAASSTPHDHPFVGAYASALRDELGLDARACKNHGGNDGRYLTAHGIPVITSRPTSGDQHSPTEWLDTESLEPFYRLYRSCIDRFSSVRT